MAELLRLYSGLFWVKTENESRNKGKRETLYCCLVCLFGPREGPAQWSACLVGLCAEIKAED